MWPVGYPNPITPTHSALVPGLRGGIAELQTVRDVAWRVPPFDWVLMYPLTYCFPGDGPGGEHQAARGAGL